MAWFGVSNQSIVFNMFSLSHSIILFLLALTTFLIFIYRKQWSRANGRKLEIGLAFFLIVLETVYQFWMLHNGLWKAGRSLPLELCNIGLILCILLLLTNKKIFFELLFFIAIFGATQAILTPALTYDFPHFRFFHFFFTHMAIIWVALYFLWVRGFELTFQSVLKLLTFINILLPVILYMNRAYNGNYWFLRHKPENPSLLDLLGPYPFYIFTLEGLLLIVCFFVWLFTRLGNAVRDRSHIGEIE